MTVTVVIGRYTGDSVIENKDVLEAGRSFEVVHDTGYLYVRNGVETTSETIAVYRPGSWESVFVGDARTPQKGDR